MKTRLLLLLLAAVMMLAACEDDSTAPRRNAPLHLVKDIPPFKDNTIYEEYNDNSNGAGDYLFAGMTQGLNTGGVGKLRRALLAFAIADSLPAGAVVDSVRLTVHISKVPDNTARATTLHRVTANWGEGASDAADPGGQGTAAEPGDATWFYRIYATESWTTTGGDFIATASAQTNFGANDTFPAWASAQMAADVQGWLDTPVTNHGWIVRGDEATEQSARRFDSSEHPTAANRPALRVYYTVTP